jgi:predicted dehydrogenase
VDGLVAVVSTRLAPLAEKEKAMSKTNVGIVGTGFMAVAHLKAYRQLDNVRVAALCNPSGRNLDGDFSDVHGNIGDDEPVKIDMDGVKTFRDYDEMLADDSIEMVDITTPTFLHHKQALAALRVGKHVLCEKPLARTSGLAREIVAAAKEAKGFFMPAMCLRFFPEWAWVKAAIDDDRFGRVLNARFRRVGEPPAWGQSSFLDGEKSGGALLDLHIHDADFVLHCFGWPKAIYAQGHTKISGEIDHVLAQYEFESGAAVSAEGSWSMTPGYGFNMSYTVNFERATVDYDLARDDESLKIFKENEEPQTLKLDAPDGYVGQIAHLLEAIETGQPPTRVTTEDGLRSVELCEAAGRAIEAGELIAL